MPAGNAQNQPLLLKYLAAEDIFSHDPVMIIDVGARGGFWPIWSGYGSQVRLIGFEPDPEECRKLNSEKKSSCETYYPFAIGRRSERRTFYVANFPPSSGFYPAEMDFIRRLPDEINLRVTNEVMIDTIDLDAFSKEYKIEKVDFIKLDIEGGELDALKGAERLLKSGVLGLNIEIGFCRYRRGMPIFSEVDTYLRFLGFELFDISSYRHARNAFPEPLGPGALPGYTKRGQVIWGEALYLRDGYAEMEKQASSGLPASWDKARILKLCTLFELFNLHDCAIELLQLAGIRNIIKESETTLFSDLLVQDLIKNPPSLTYKEYMSSLQAYHDEKTAIRQHRAKTMVRVMRHVGKILPQPLKRVAKSFIEMLQ